MYEYKCNLISVVNGNTVEAEIDLGFNVRIRQTIRLFGISTPDPQSKNEIERTSAARSRDCLVSILPSEFIVHTVMTRRGKSGRILGHIFVDHAGVNVCINDLLVTEGYATRHESVDK